MIGPDGLAPRRVSFVTGTLAAPALRRVLAAAAPPFAWDVVVLKITVAALMTASWISRRLTLPPGTDLVVLPGACEGDLTEIERHAGVPAVRGPVDLRDLPGALGASARTTPYGAYDIAIVAEITDAPRRSPTDVVARAHQLRAAGADLIDIGCLPGVPFPALGEMVATLVAGGFRVSVDSADPAEIRTALRAGAELVLSVTGGNLEVVPDLVAAGARAVVTPDLGGALDTMDATAAVLARAGVPCLLDPILAPIGHGFMASLERYAEVRRRHPQAEMLMGVGNLTEMTAADSTGVNALLAAVCQELAIRTVLTTAVASWCAGAVAELDVARRLMHYAVTQQVAPKGVDDRLVTRRDPRLASWSEAELREMQAAIRDPNVRIFADPEAITVFDRERFVRGTDVEALFAALEVDEPSHAFYLGQELGKAQLARALGKVYRQDAPLGWGCASAPAAPAARHVTLTAGRRRRAGTL